MENIGYGLDEEQEVVEAVSSEPEQENDTGEATQNEDLRECEFPDCETKLPMSDMYQVGEIWLCEDHKDMENQEQQTEPETKPETEEKPKEPVKTLAIEIGASILKSAMTKLSCLVDEIKLRFDGKGISVSAVDPAHVAMCKYEIPRHELMDYRIYEINDNYPGNTYSPETPIEIGLDIDKMKEFLSCLKITKKSDPCILIELYDAYPEDYLLVSSNGTTRKMGLVDTAGMVDPKIPNLNLPNQVDIETSLIIETLKSCESVSEHVALTCTVDPKTLVVTAEGDTDKITRIFDENQAYTYTIKDATRSMYPLDYISKIFKSLKDNKQIKISIGNDYPVRIDFDGGTFLLAPEIES